MLYPHKCVGYRGRKCHRITYKPKKHAANPLCAHCQEMYDNEPAALSELEQQPVARVVPETYVPTRAKIERVPARPLAAYSGEKFARKVNEYLRAANG